MNHLDRAPLVCRPSRLGRCSLLVFLLFAYFTTPTTTLADQATDKLILRKLQAGFVYNFIRFTTWPAASLPEEAPLVIAIIGESNTAETLRRELDAKTSGKHPIISKLVEPEDSLEGVHIVFLLKKASITPAELSKRIGKRPILTIGEADNFTQSGGMIRLFVRDDTVHFTLNVRAARDSDITLSSQLGSMAETDNP